MDSNICFLITVVTPMGGRAYQSRHAVSFDKDHSPYTDEYLKYFCENPYYDFWHNLLPDHATEKTIISDIQPIDSVLVKE